MMQMDWIPGFLKNGAHFRDRLTGTGFRLDGLAGLTTGDYVKVPLNTAVMNSPGPLGLFYLGSLR